MSPHDAKAAAIEIMILGRAAELRQHPTHPFRVGPEDEHAIVTAAAEIGSEHPDFDVEVTHDESRRVCVRAVPTRLKAGVPVKEPPAPAPKASGRKPRKHRGK